jgi:sugar phosphate permease
MRKTLLAVASIVMIGVPTALAAQERAVDGTLGAVAGAVVLGPVGLVTGAVVGVTAGPAISSSWGLHHHHHYRHVRYVPRSRQ